MSCCIPVNHTRKYIKDSWIKSSYSCIPARIFKMNNNERLSNIQHLFLSSLNCESVQFLFVYMNGENHELTKGKFSISLNITVDNEYARIYSHSSYKYTLIHTNTHTNNNFNSPETSYFNEILMFKNCLIFWNEYWIKIIENVLRLFILITSLF